MTGVGARFARVEPRLRAREYVSGLVAGLERKNGWTLAERAGESGPQGMQRLLRRGTRTRGSDCRSVPVLTGHVNTTGRAGRSTGRGLAVAGIGCWPGAASPPPGRSPTTRVTGRRGPGWSIWPSPPGHAGTSKRRFSRPKAKRGSTTTRSADTGPGMPTSPCLYSPSRNSLPRKRLQQRGIHRHRSRHDRPHATGDPPPARRAGPAPPLRSRSRLGQVTMATPTTTPSPAVALATTRPPTHLSVVAILVDGRISIPLFVNAFQTLPFALPSLLAMVLMESPAS